MGELATLGIIVDASGARREIKLTRDELISLANTGKLTQTSLAQTVPPTVAPQMAVAAKSAQQATISFGRLREGMTGLAFAATGLPGPLGQVASTLGMLTLGGGVTVGVLAGIAAISFAYQKLTEQSRKTREELEKSIDVLRKLKREQDLGITGEAGAATAATRARIDVIRAQLAPMNQQIADLQAIGGPTQDLVAGAIRRRSELVREMSRLQTLVAAGEKEITKIIADEQAERQKDADAAFMRRMESIRSEYERRTALEAQLVAGIARHLAEIDDAMAPMRAIARGAPVWGPGAAADDGFRIDPVVLASIQAMLEKMKEMDEATKRAAALRVGTFVGFVGGMASQMGGPFGSAAAGVISGIGGGPAGMAIGGVSGLVSGLLGLADSAQRAREAIRLMKIAHEAYMDSIMNELGTLSDADAAERATRREIAAQQRALLPINGPFDPNNAQQRQALEMIFGPEEAARRIAAWLELAGVLDDLIEKRREEADQVERLTTAMRNSPTGFFIEQYLGAHAARGGTTTMVGPWTDVAPGGGGADPGRTRRGSGINIERVIFQLPSGTTDEQVRSFAKALDRFAASSIGAGASRSQALDLVS